MSTQVTISIPDEHYSFLKRDESRSVDAMIKRLIHSAYKAHLHPRVLYIDDFLFNHFDFNRGSKVLASKLFELYLYECETLKCKAMGKKHLYNELRNTSGLHLDTFGGNKLWIRGLSL